MSIINEIQDKRYINYRKNYKKYNIKAEIL